MAIGVDALIEHLLAEIALCGSRGKLLFPALSLVHALLHCYFQSEPAISGHFSIVLQYLECIHPTLPFINARLRWGRRGLAGVFSAQRSSLAWSNPSLLF